MIDYRFYDKDLEHPLLIVIREKGIEEIPQLAYSTLPSYLGKKSSRETMKQFEKPLEVGKISKDGPYISIEKTSRSSSRPYTTSDDLLEHNRIISHEIIMEYSRKISEGKLLTPDFLRTIETTIHYLKLGSLVTLAQVLGKYIKLGIFRQKELMDKFLSINEHINIMVIEQLMERVKRGEMIDPEMCKLNLMTDTEVENAADLYRELENRIEPNLQHRETYEEAQRNISRSIVKYYHREGAERIKKYCKEKGIPIPEMLRGYVESAELE